ncbi:MAG: hypothetical protein AAF385_17685, partial [Pseudomonadota bacterium]
SQIDEDTGAAIDKFMQEVLSVCWDLLIFLDEYLRRTLDAFSVVPGCNSAYIEINVEEHLDEVRIPVLCDTAKKN